MILKSNLQFKKHEAEEIVLQNSAVHPLTPVAGQVYYGTANIGNPIIYHQKHIRYYDGTIWQELATRAWVEDEIAGISSYEGWLINSAENATNAWTVASNNKIAFLQGTDIETSISTAVGAWSTRAISISHASVSKTTGSLDSSSHISSITVSSTGHVTHVNTVARSVRWNESTTATNNIPYWNSETGILNRTGYAVIKSTPTGITSPGSDSNLITEKALVEYIRDHIHGLSGKESARAASTVNINLSNPGTAVFDGVTLVSGNRVLVKDQSTTSQNGIYVFNGSTSAMTRAEDANAWIELVSAYIFVDEGTLWKDSGWLCTVDTGGTLGATAVEWVKFFTLGDTTATNIGDGEHVYVDGEVRPFEFRSLNSTNTVGTALSVGTNVADDEIIYNFNPANVDLVAFGGVLSAAKGGTGLSTYATGDILYASNTTTLARRQATTNGYVLSLVSGLPQWVDVGTVSGAITAVNNTLFCGAIAGTTLNLWACTSRTNDRFYRHADNPNAANTGIKYAGNMSVYGMNVYQNLAVTGTSTLTGNLFLGSVTDISILGTPSNDWNFLLIDVGGTGPWQVQRISLGEILQGANGAEHYMELISGTTDTVLADDHGCGTDPIVILREISGSNYLDVYGDIYVNGSGDVTWSVDTALPVGSKIIIMGSKEVRT
jgi:hypothetical protein